MDSLKVSTRLLLLTGVLTLMLLLMGALGLWGAHSSQEALRTVYEDRAVPLGQLAEIQRRELTVQLDLVHAIADPDDAAALESDAARQVQAVDAVWSAYMATYLTPEEKRQADALGQMRARFRSEAQAPLQAALKDGDKALANRLYDERVHPGFEALTQATSALVALQIDIARQAYDEAVVRYRLQRNVAVAALLGGLAFGAVFGFALARSLVRQLGAEPRDASALARAVAEGDLSRPIVLRPGDVHSVMAMMKRMQEQLQATVAVVRHNADGVSVAATQIAQGHRDLSQRTEEQASALQQTAASMEQITGSVQANAGHARDAVALSQQAAGVARQGETEIRGVVETMRGIHDSSRRIAEIVTVIDGISFQTNLLALNAAVEAARAGDQGRGFAVVAGEVRSLAQRAARSAQEIKQLIAESVQRVEAGSSQVQRASLTMGEIDRAIRGVTELITQIGDASAEQSSGVAQIGQAVAQMDQVTQQNAALVEEASAASESLRQQASQLVSSVAVFRLAAAA